ncbi:MAG: hypothetical protein WCD18_13650 [Thermosynechococcaceae cyanobacterium]
MMTTQIQPLSQITQHAIEILSKEIGIANTIRFLSQFSTGYGNYTEERDTLYKDLTLEEVLNLMKNTQHSP